MSHSAQCVSFPGQQMYEPDDISESKSSRAFPVAAARIWNTLPVNVVSASTVQSFRHKLTRAQLVLRWPTGTWRGTFCKTPIMHDTWRGTFCKTPLKPPSVGGFGPPSNRWSLLSRARCVPKIIPIAYVRFSLAEVVTAKCACIRNTNVCFWPTVRSRPMP